MTPLFSRMASAPQLMARWLFSSYAPENLQADQRQVAMTIMNEIGGPDAGEAMAADCFLPTALFVEGKVSVLWSSQFFLPLVAGLSWEMSRRIIPDDSPSFVPQIVRSDDAFEMALADVEGSDDPETCLLVSLCSAAASRLLIHDPLLHTRLAYTRCHELMVKHGNG